jgi:hypothetical protein
MNDLYSEQALKNLLASSHEMLRMCKQKRMEVCQNFIEALKRLKTQYPSFATRAEQEINRAIDYYEIMELNEGTMSSNDKWFGVFEYNIQNTYGELFKIILTVNPELRKYLN